MTKKELETFSLNQQAEQDWKEQASAEEIEEYERWREMLDVDYELELRRERRHRKEHLDGMDITLLDQRSEDSWADSTKALRIATDEDYLDLIFSRRPKDLHELVTKARQTIIEMTGEM